MSESEHGDHNGEVLASRIVIERHLETDGTYSECVSVSKGSSIVEVLGMLRVAEYIAIATHNEST